jgi:hypothetical protein
MCAAPSYWATDEDEHFEAGHYVEAWELTRLTQLSPAVSELLRQQHSLGNKVRAIAAGFVELAQPLGEQVWSLPEGLAFWCPLQEPPVGHYDGDEDGAVVCLTNGTRVFPTGHEGASRSDPLSIVSSAA